METRRLTREERLKLKRDFRRVFSEGKSVFNEYLRLVYLENGLDHPRIAIIVRKKVGKAVFRNRLKRLMREVYRLNKEKFPNIDAVFLFREKAKELKGAKYPNILEITMDLLEKIR